MSDQPPMQSGKGPYEAIIGESVVFRRQLTGADRNGVYGASEMVVLWLNAAFGTAAYKRVTSIYRLSEKLVRAYGDWESREDGQKVDLWTEIASTEKELNAMLRTFVSYPQLHYHLSIDAQKRGRIQVLPENDYDSQTELGFWLFFDDAQNLRPEGAQEIATENSTVEFICRLFERRKLDSVKLCEHCELKWRVSTRAIDRFCSAECRTAFYMRSSEYKQRQRANQAKYRENLKENLARGYKGK